MPSDTQVEDLHIRRFFVVSLVVRQIGYANLVTLRQRGRGGSWRRVHCASGSSSGRVHVRASTSSRCRVDVSGSRGSCSRGLDVRRSSSTRCRRGRTHGSGRTGGDTRARHSRIRDVGAAADVRIRRSAEVVSRRRICRHRRRDVVQRSAVSLVVTRRSVATAVRPRGIR